MKKWVLTSSLKRRAAIGALASRTVTRKLSRRSGASATSNLTVYCRRTRVGDEWTLAGWRVGGFDWHPHVFAEHDERRAHEEQERMRTALRHLWPLSGPPRRQRRRAPTRGAVAMIEGRKHGTQLDIEK